VRLALARWWRGRDGARAGGCTGPIARGRRCVFVIEAPGHIARSSRACSRRAAASREHDERHAAGERRGCAGRRVARGAAGGVSGTLPGADVRGFYRALGIELAGWAQPEAPVRCFAAPTAHARQDRDASCSVNVESGLWHCHGCAAGGGPYDAAPACGRTPREAMDLLVAYGLVERRTTARPSRRRVAAAARPAGPSRPHVPLSTWRWRLAMLTWSGAVSSWSRCAPSLLGPPATLTRLARPRA
jgi:hypothetical protein